MKLTQPQKKLIGTVKQGAGKYIQHNEGTYLTIDGRPLSKRVVNNLIKKNVVVPSGDGLIGGFTQTYEVVYD